MFEIILNLYLFLDIWEMLIMTKQKVLFEVLSMIKYVNYVYYPKDMTCFWRI